MGRLLKATGVPWIADLRDGWTFDPPRPAWPTSLQSALDGRLERHALARADRVVAVTPPIAQDLERKLGRPVSVITNGFDPEERVAADSPALDPDRHSLVHTGRLSVVGRSPRTFFDGLGEYLRRRPDGAQRLEVVLAGPVSSEQESLLAGRRLDGLVRAVGRLDRLERLAPSAPPSTLLVLAGQRCRPARSVATGKLFEYLGADDPCSCSAPTARPRGSCARRAPARSLPETTRTRSHRSASSGSPIRLEAAVRGIALLPAAARRALGARDRAACDG